jgi:hypothetical protein
VSQQVSAHDQARRIKAIKLFFAALALLLIALVFCQCVQQRSTTEPPLERFLSELGAAQEVEEAAAAQSAAPAGAAGENTATDPLGLAAVGTTEISFVESSADGRVLFYTSAASVQVASAYLDQALRALGWQPMDSQQQSLLSYCWVQGSSVSAYALAYLQDNSEGCSIVIQLA